jgi:hypothetical protein
VRFNLSNIRFPFSRAPRIATLYPGQSPFAGKQHVAPPAAPKASDAEQRRVERAQEFEHFLRAMSSGEAEQRYGHLRQQPVAATGTTRPAPARSSAAIAGRAGFLPTPNQQAAYDEQLHRDAGSLLPPEQSAAASHLILRSVARAEGKNPDTRDKRDDDDDDEDADDHDNQEEAKRRRKRKAAEDKDGDDKDDDDVEAAARARERSRVQHIVNSPAGLENPIAAWCIALETSIPRDEAVTVLAALGATTTTPRTQRHDSLRDRMASEVNPNVGVGAPSGGPDLSTSEGTAAFICLQDRRRRGETTP